MGRGPLSTKKEARQSSGIPAPEGAQTVGPPGGRAIVQIVSVAVLIGVLAAVRYAFRGVTTPAEAVALLRSVRESPWGIPAYLGSYLGLTSAFFPAVLLHVAAGATWGFGPGAALNVVIFNLTSWIQYFVATWLGERRVQGWLRRTALLKLDEKARAHGIRTTLAIRSLPLPMLLANLSCAVAGIRFRDFAAGTLIGGLPYLLIYTYFAAAIAEGAAGAGRRALIGGAVAGVLLLAAALVPRFWRRRDRS